MIRLFLLLALFSLFSLHAETLKLATLNWPPYCAEDLPEQGVLISLTREVFKRAGYDLHIDFLPWIRALEETRKGHYDGLIAAYLNTDRNNFLYYPNPLLTSREVFVSTKGVTDKYNSMDDFKNKLIGVVRGFSFTPGLMSQGFEIYEVTEDVQVLRMLFIGRVDLIIIEEKHLIYLMDTVKELEPYRNSYTILDPPFADMDLYCAISRLKQGGDLISHAFNQALMEMKLDGTYMQILERLQFPPYSKPLQLQR
jgi:polar amino acid transport system substrate-binding protein